MMERLSDKAIEIINDLHTERLDYDSEYLPLIEAAQRLAYYEDLEEQGRLMVLPCKKDEPVYVIRGEKEKYKPMKYRVVECHIDHFTIGGTGIPMITACDDENVWYEPIDGTQVGHEYWLTREEAEQALGGADRE